MKEKIRVNSVNPGMVETEGLHAAGFVESDFRKMVAAQTPLGRIGQPEDIARAAVFFASDDAGWVTGQTLLLAGGQRRRRRILGTPYLSLNAPNGAGYVE